MDVALVNALRCPFCSGELSVAGGDRGERGLDYAVLSCHCGRYPVVAGIPILKKGRIASAGQTADEVVELVRTGRHQEALLAMLMPPEPEYPDLAPAWIRALPSVKGLRRLTYRVHRKGLRRWRESTASALTDPEDARTTREILYYYFRRSGFPLKTAYDYFTFRFSQPRHLIALSFATIIDKPRKPVLDLGCGLGHITRSLVERAGDQRVIGLDGSFFLLYVAKCRIAPDAEYLCGQADLSLPFQDGFCSIAFCSDAFHAFTNKVTSVRELKRVTAGDGVIMLITLQNGLVNHLARAYPLPPEGYQGLVADRPYCLLGGVSVLERYLRREGPAMARSSEVEEVAGEPWLSLVVSTDRTVFRNYGRFEDWPHATGRLAVNPLYAESGRDNLGNVNLRRIFPGSFYEAENAECKAYLPEAVSVHETVLSEIAQGRRTPQVDRLVEQCVVVGMPDRY
jgi:SAM-dependent methyltransferase/uncharacterized protein YbaR (Trm112 family)